MKSHVLFLTAADSGGTTRLNLICPSTPPAASLLPCRCDLSCEWLGLECKLPVFPGTRRPKQQLAYGEPHRVSGGPLAVITSMVHRAVCGSIAAAWKGAMLGANVLPLMILLPLGLGQPAGLGRSRGRPASLLPHWALTQPAGPREAPASNSIQTQAWNSDGSRQTQSTPPFSSSLSPPCPTPEL